jgi:CDP-glucose 4,6-dehydratase
VEGVEMNQAFWKNKKVFITGHTGFKGGWLVRLLVELNAKVYGYALNPPTEPNFYTETKLEEIMMHSTNGDIRDLKQLSNAIKLAKPDIIIHMAAQSLVRNSYNNPVETFTTNVMGTVNLFEALRESNTVKAIVNITTDKCYENKEWTWPYRENDPLGGHDPYSASKACAEIVTAAYRKSFLSNANIHVATARAGNVIGGGDWALDRLIPDYLRALNSGEVLKIRSPNAIRPWQHVLEPLSGYVLLAEKIYEHGEKFTEAWNFGPDDNDAKPVEWVIKKLSSQIPGVRWETETVKQLHEANVLKLDCSKAKKNLGWMPLWNLETALEKTADWHKAWDRNEDMATYSNKQIVEFINK